MQNISVIVTGAGGFIGSHLCLKLLDSKCSVIGIDNFCTGDRRNLKLLKSHPNSQNLRFIEDDCTKSWPDLIGEVDKLDLVIHLASPASPPLYQSMPLETLRVNSTGLKEALMFATDRKARVVFASTSEVYGDALVHPQPESYWGNVNSFGPRSCYDEAKRFGEALLYTWNQVHGTKHGLFRIFNTYGPQMNPEDGRVIVNFLEQARKSEPLTIYGDGSQTRSFCYVSDLVDGILKYAASDLAEPVNLGNPKEFSILELVETIKDIYGKELETKFLPLPTDDPMQRQPDISKAKESLNWSPKIELKEGLQKTMSWLSSL